MPTGSRAANVMDREFLGIRGRLIELAAALDRIDRAEGAASGDPRREQIRRSLEILAAGVSNRTEQVQLEFSLAYDEKWQS
jgi:hypothetical protein